MDVDIDGDGKVDSYEHVGCYALSPTASVELEKLDGEEQMTKMVRGGSECSLRMARQWMNFPRACAIQHELRLHQQPLVRLQQR